MLRSVVCKGAYACWWFLMDAELCWEPRRYAHNSCKTTRCCMYYHGKTSQSEEGLLRCLMVQ